MPSTSLHSTMFKYWDNQIVIYTVHIILKQSRALRTLASSVLFKQNLQKKQELNAFVMVVAGTQLIVTQYAQNR